MVAAVVMKRPLQQFIWWKQTERRVSANHQIKSSDLGSKSASRLLPSTSTIAIYSCYSQPKSWYSLYHPMQDGRLSWPRHCSKGVWVVSKVVYWSHCRDKHNCPQWDLNPRSLSMSIRHIITRPLWHAINCSTSLDIKIRSFRRHSSQPIAYIGTQETNPNLTKPRREPVDHRILQRKIIIKPECGPMSNVMVALPNIAGALCSTLQSLARTHSSSAGQ